MAKSSKAFIKNVKDLMTRQGLNQAQLAKRCGQFPTAVNRWINGETTPGLEAVDSIASALGTTAAALLKDEAGEPVEAVLPSFEESLSKVVRAAKRGELVQSVPDDILDYLGHADETDFLAIRALMLGTANHMAKKSPKKKNA